MAQFSSGAVHYQRRSEIERAIAALPRSGVRSSASRRVAERLDGSRVDAVTDVAHHVPTEALADVLGAGTAALELTSDVRLIAEVIGRGEPSSRKSDEAAGRLLDRFRTHPLGAVPVVSLLYQNCDATAAFLAATVLSRHEGGARRCAVARTVGVASRDVQVRDRQVRAGTTALLDLETSGLEFGAGPHRCLGREIAEAIVQGTIEALSRHRYRVLADLVVLEDGRPVALPMEPG